MKKNIVILLGLSLVACTLQAQTGIGTQSPNTNAVLEVVSADKGLLIPRIGLTGGTGSPSPLVAHVAGMLIYNTGTSGTSSNAVSPGFYFNDGSKWIRVADAVAGDPTKDPWVDDSTAGQVELGTLSDGNPRATGTEFVVKDDGKVGIGTGTAGPTETLDVNGNLKVRTISTKSVWNKRDARKVLFVESNSDGTLNAVSKTDMIDVLMGAGVLVRQTSNNVWNGIKVGSNAGRLTFIGRLSLRGITVSFEVIYRPRTGFVVLSQYNCTVTQVDASTLRVQYNTHNIYDMVFTASDPAVTGGVNFYDVTATPTSGWIQGTFQSIPLNF